MKPEKVDAVIVGAGASGGVVAKELAVAGLRTVLLERGPDVRVEDFLLHDELALRDGTAPKFIFRAADRRIPREFRNQGDNDFRLRYPDQGGYVWMGGIVGGGQLNYAGLMWRRPQAGYHTLRTCTISRGLSILSWCNPDLPIRCLDSRSLPGIARRITLCCPNPRLPPDTIYHPDSHHRNPIARQAPFWLDSRHNMSHNRPT